MRNLSRACVVSVALITGSAAQAADLAPYRAPPPVAAFTWSGVYVGGTLGWAWGTFNPRSSTVVAGYLQSTDDVAVVNAAGNQSLKANGMTGGIGAGVNWQTGQLVLGLEVDMQAVRLGGTVITGGRYQTGAGEAFTFTTSITSNWLLTVRPRIGWAIDNWLIYATGGLAVSDLSANFMWADAAQPQNVSEAATFTTVKAGYVVGGGIETAFGPRWSVKAEYLYVRMNTASLTGSPAQSPGQVFAHSAELHASFARVGANFRF